MAFGVNVTLRLSTAATTAGFVSSTFAKNHGPDMAEVLTRTSINFPATPKPATPPAPFKYLIPFKTPFLYKGTSGLCWEMRVHLNTSARLGNFLDSANTASTYRRFGTGCRATGQAKDAYLFGHIYGNTTIPNTWLLYVCANYLAKNQAYAWMIGVNDKRWGGFPLPLDLTPFGGTGCSIYIAPIFMAGGMTDQNGKVDTRINPFIFPRDPILSGRTLLSQCLSVDPGRPAWPLVFTDGCAVLIPKRIEPVSRIYALSDDTATSGKVNLMYGMVTRFAYR